MREIEKIPEKYKSIDFTKRKAAIASVVKLEGSSCRRPGARMLMTDDGTFAEAPEEIAISIIAEIKADFSNRDGFLKIKPGPIHSSETESVSLNKSFDHSSSLN